VPEVSDCNTEVPDAGDVKGQVYVVLAVAAPA